MTELDPAFAERIRREYREYRQDPDVMHNRDLHRRILAAWRQDSPEFVARLEAAGLLHQAAFVAQERMWREEDRLLNAGYPVTDAREQAERTCLMLGPDRLEPTEGELARQREMGRE